MGPLCRPGEPGDDPAKGWRGRDVQCSTNNNKTYSPIFSPVPGQVHVALLLADANGNDKETRGRYAALSIQTEAWRVEKTQMLGGRPVHRANRRRNLTTLLIDLQLK